ncbi:ChbG/HpnK family deacetylase [Chryseobacterium binzhouense]|uniref:ChbG/HpnK family deacetylase n=1 Tax=Chryseobacterium binzhouense TaxID=2593646 RepID=UPI00117D9CAB|nr:ChbG/HpnK family deacetylase [Chryseobacterium binzhouense]
MKNRLIVNADDFGLSVGVNQAILKANTEGFLNSASLMANTDFFDHAIKEIIPNCSNLNVGLHINLTCCKALSGKSTITDKNGFLTNDFIRLLFLRKSEKNLQIIETEIELQLKKLLENNVKISHIDGHEHVHIIPSINKIVHKLANKYNIERIREINENFGTTFKYNLRTATVANVIKFFLLKFLSSFNQNKNEREFYTILNTCEINSENLFNYLESQNGKTVEIMLHPSLKEFDNKKMNLDRRFEKFLKSDFRKQEYDLCFNKKFKEYAFFGN